MLRLSSFGLITLTCLALLHMPALAQKQDSCPEYPGMPAPVTIGNPIDLPPPDIPGPCPTVVLPRQATMGVVSTPDTAA